MPKIEWDALAYTRANRIRKLCETDEYTLIHEERIRPNFGREDAPDDGSIRIWYDATEKRFYHETAYQGKPSTWAIADLPEDPDSIPPEEDD